MSTVTGLKNKLMEKSYYMKQSLPGPTIDRIQMGLRSLTNTLPFSKEVGNALSASYQKVGGVTPYLTFLGVATELEYLGYGNYDIGNLGTFMV